MLSVLAPWLILLAVALYGVIHSLLATLWAKACARRWFGVLGRRGYRLAYNLFALLSLIPVLALALLLPDLILYIIPLPWVLVTLLVQGLAVVALLVGLLQTDPWSFLGVRQLVNSERDEPGQLVVSGVYRYVRHPLYTAGLVFIWLTPVMTRNLLVLNIGLSLYIVIGATFEERRLSREFGEAYLNYRQRTPMLIPLKFKS